MSRNLAKVLDDLFALAKAAPSFLVELQPLSLSLDEAVEGSPVITNILGATSGGRISCTPPDGMTFDRTALRIAGTPMTVGEYDISLRETHPQGSNSPKVSVVRFIVMAKPIIPIDQEPYIWGDPRLAWGQSGIAWGQALPDGAAPVDPPTAVAFWSDPFWTRVPFWAGSDATPSTPAAPFWSDPFWTRTPFWR
ncbi:hypothetical protein [Sphingomonas sp. CFBP 8760]|uniref:hypothetical protein n=1 Tax=Sphingomonas sp. CFBP 8760 TaxID=2775282 RepID=UPI00177AF8E4|nr:hypothetical protein [Sphingomonas sp. CFBP 8760]MBD8547902.1 hypothetical protein [Sphingomonas sp. CFBP 8760]